MATLEERVAHLEGQMQGLSQGLTNVKDSIVRLNENIVRRDEKMSASIVRLDEKMSASIVRLDEKMSRQFLWLVGMLVTVLAAVAGGLLSR